MVVINRSLKSVSSKPAEEYVSAEPMWFLMDAGVIFSPSAAGMKYYDFNNVKLPRSYKEGGQHLISYNLTMDNVNYLFGYLEKVAYKFWFVNNGTLVKINGQSEFNNAYSTLEMLLGTQGYIEVLWEENICLAGDEDTVDGIWPNAFKYFTQLTGTLTFPDTIKSIGASSFYDCTGLTSILFNEGLERIGNAAFNGCTGLAGELVLPSTIKTIEATAFYGCRGITSITLKATTPPTLSDASAIPDSVTKICIPEGTLGAYQSATNWSSFFNIFDDGTVKDDSAGDSSGGDTSWDDGWNEDWGI